MKLTWTSILITDNTWTLGLSDGNRVFTMEISAQELSKGESSLNQAAIAAVKAAKQANAAFRPLVVGLPSTWCFSAHVSTDNLQKRQRAQGLTYRLEEKLPVDAEVFTASFREMGSEAWGVAVINEPARRVLAALEHAGLTVAHICPTALLVHSACRDETSDPGNGVDLIATDSSTADLICVRDDEITAWRSLPLDADLLANEIDILKSSSSKPPLIRGIGLPPDYIEEIQISLGREITELHRIPDAAHKIAAFYSDRLVRRGSPPPVDLRCEELSGRGTWKRVATPARTAAVAAILLLLSFTIGNLITARQHQQATLTRENQQAALFRETFPGQRLPAAPLSRFRSEARKAQGTAGTENTRPDTPRTLHRLQVTLASLPIPGISPGNASGNSAALSNSSSTNTRPVSMRFRIFELRLEVDRFYLDGQTRSHADAERLADGLRQALPYTFSPPRTQNLQNNLFSRQASSTSDYSGSMEDSGGGGVAFTLTGQREEVTP